MSFTLSDVHVYCVLLILSMLPNGLQYTFVRVTVVFSGGMSMSAVSCHRLMAMRLLPVLTSSNSRILRFDCGVSFNGDTCWDIN